MKMKDKVALLIGASEGIGRATAIRLAREGAHVVVAARRSKPLEEVRAIITSEGGSIEVRMVDAADGDAVVDLVNATAKAHSRLDALLNCAMLVDYAPLTELTLDRWRKVFSINMEAVFLSTRAAMPLMAEGGGGAILNMTSINALRAMEGMASYSASKAAVIQFTSVAAIEGARLGVRVNCMAPGVIATPGTAAMTSDEETTACVADAVPMGRLGRPEEAGNAAYFLLSDESSYITGVCLSVDGGKAAQLYVPM